ncbi:MAG TPA: DUF4440 domain-containing protein [Caulobacteraceae bacterium]
MKAETLLACLTALSLCAACTPAVQKPHVNAARVVDTIRSDEVKWNADWKSGDAAKVAAHFSTGAVVMPPDAPAMTGRAAIEAGLQPLLNDKAFALTFSSDKVDVAASGDLAVSRGAFTQTYTDPATKAPMTIKGAFVTVWQPGPGGAWQAVWDIATPGGPPSPAGATQ